MYRIEEAREACKIDDDWKSLAVLDASWCRSWERPTRHLDRMTSFSRRRQNCGLVALGDLQSRNRFQWKRLQCICWMLLLKCTTGGNIDIQVIRVLTKTPATGAWFSPVGYYCKISPRENVTVVLWHCYWITRASETSEGITIIILFSVGLKRKSICTALCKTIGLFRIWNDDAIFRNCCCHYTSGNCPPYWILGRR